MQVPFYKRVLSWLMPINIEKGSSNFNAILLLQLYRNQWMLSTPDAIYSWGKKYDPYMVMFKCLQNEVKSKHTFLMLGTGLGSALQILQQKYNCFPASTLVDIDEQILHWSMEYMNLNTNQNVRWICQEGVGFMKENKAQYDLIALDIFIDTLVPKDILSEDFVNNIYGALQNNGVLCMNYISKIEHIDVGIRSSLENVFTSVECITHHRNTFFICKKIS